MHRSIRDNLEEVLAGTDAGSPLPEHLKNCEECSGEVNAMREQARSREELGGAWAGGPLKLLSSLA